MQPRWPPQEPLCPRCAQERHTWGEPWHARLYKHPSWGHIRLYDARCVCGLCRPACTERRLTIALQTPQENAMEHTDLLERVPRTIPPPLPGTPKWEPPSVELMQRVLRGLEELD